MKTLRILMLCSFAVLTLGACETMQLGNFDDAPPYEQARTATHTQTAPITVPEPVAPAPAPIAEKQCSCDYSTWESRAIKAEEELMQCRTASERVRSEYRNTLKK